MDGGLVVGPAGMASVLENRQHIEHQEKSACPGSEKSACLGSAIWGDKYPVR